MSPAHLRSLPALVFGVAALCWGAASSQGRQQEAPPRPAYGHARIGCGMAWRDGRPVAPYRVPCAALDSLYAAEVRSQGPLP